MQMGVVKYEKAFEILCVEHVTEDIFGEYTLVENTHNATIAEAESNFGYKFPFHCRKDSLADCLSGTHLFHLGI